MPLFTHGSRGGPEIESDRILTVPNAISLVRLLLLPLIYADIVGGREIRGLIVLLIVSWTDFIDGYVARRFDQVSRLGKLLDPAIDRLLIVVVLVAMLVAGILPWWAVAALLARDALVLGGGLVLMTRDVSPPAVTELGKATTFGMMFVLPLFLLAAGLGSGHLRAAGWVLLVAYGLLYYLTAVQYALDAVAGLGSGGGTDRASDEGTTHGR
jgi:cardiolipin synthase (CMP-forming)